MLIRAMVLGIVSLILVAGGWQTAAAADDGDEPRFEAAKPEAKPKGGKKKSANIKPDPNGQSIEQWRIHRTTEELATCIRDLRKAPHDFGGERDAAIAAAEAAIDRLKAAYPHARTQTQVEADRAKSDGGKKP